MSRGSSTFCTARHWSWVFSLQREPRQRTPAVTRANDHRTTARDAGPGSGESCDRIPAKRGAANQRLIPAVIQRSPTKGDSPTGGAVGTTNLWAETRHPYPICAYAEDQLEERDAREDQDDCSGGQTDRGGSGKARRPVAREQPHLHPSCEEQPVTPEAGFWWEAPAEHRTRWIKVELDHPVNRWEHEGAGSISWGADLDRLATLGEDAVSIIKEAWEQGGRTLMTGPSRARRNQSPSTDRETYRRRIDQINAAQPCRATDNLQPARPRLLQQRHVWLV
jgi:hypothetical protein